MGPGVCSQPPTWPARLRWALSSPGGGAGRGRGCVGPGKPLLAHLMEGCVGVAGGGAGSCPQDSRGREAAWGSGQMNGPDFPATLLRAHVLFGRHPPCGPGSWRSSGSSQPVVWHPGLGVCPTAWLGTRSSSLGLPGSGVLGERPLGARLGWIAPCQIHPPGGTLVGLALSEILLPGGVGIWGGGSQVPRAQPGPKGRSRELTLSSSRGHLHGLLSRVCRQYLEGWVCWSR